MEIAAYGVSGRDAFWFYARQWNDRCRVHFEEVEEEYLEKEKKLQSICASLIWRRHLTGCRERYWSEL